MRNLIKTVITLTAMMVAVKAKKQESNELTSIYSMLNSFEERLKRLENH